MSQTITYRGSPCRDGWVTATVAHMATSRRRASDVPSVAAARRQLQEAKKREEALRRTVANERKAQHELRQMEAQLRRTEGALQRAARSGASHVISGSKSVGLSSSRNKGRIVSPAKSRATIREAVKSIDHQLRQSMEAEKVARKELRGGK